MQTLERARELKLQVHMLPAWYAVDDVEGLGRLHRELRAARGKPELDPHMPHYLTANAALMRSLPVGELAGGWRETDRQIPIGSA